MVRIWKNSNLTHHWKFILLTSWSRWSWYWMQVTRIGHEICIMIHWQGCEFMNSWLWTDVFIHNTQSHHDMNYLFQSWVIFGTNTDHSDHQHCVVRLRVSFEGKHLLSLSFFCSPELGFESPSKLQLVIMSTDILDSLENMMKHHYRQKKCLLSIIAWLSCPGIRVQSFKIPVSVHEGFGQKWAI